MSPRGVSALVALVLLGAGCGRTGRADGVDLDGKAVDPLARPGAVTVLLFVATDCPISNREVPEMLRLRARFEPEGVSFWLVYPTAEESTGAIRAHLHDFSLPFPALHDPRHALTAEARVTVTPEAAVFRGHELAYHGRIDDRQISLGDTRPEATRHDLALAVEAALAGKTPPAPGGPPFGCAIVQR